VRWPVTLVLVAGVLLLAGACMSADPRPWLVFALALAGWWWGGARLDALDRSVLLGRVDTSERARLVVTTPARRSRFELRVPAQVRRFGPWQFREAVLLELPLGRAPPQGAVL
jgi:hypothetical protein